MHIYIYSPAPPPFLDRRTSHWGTWTKGLTRRCYGRG